MGNDKLDEDRVKRMKSLQEGINSEWLVVHKETKEYFPVNWPSAIDYSFLPDYDIRRIVKGTIEHVLYGSNKEKK